jgi:tRNA threonylcarbamoyladenosine biosynthesis protein TsaB
MLLAIDTATHAISLALHDGRALYAEQTWHTANNHTAELAPTIHHLLARCEMSVNHLTALAVSTGPGSFTGLRIGVSLAKGMASARRLPLVGVSTLDTLAAGQPAYPRHDLICVVEAGRGRIIALTYQLSKGQWISQGEPHLMDWEILLTNINSPTYITGDIDAAGHERLAVAVADNAPVKLAVAASRLRRAGYLADVAFERLRNASMDTFAPALLIPQYVKTRDIP